MEKPRSPKPAPIVTGTIRGARICGHQDDFKILKGEPTAYTEGRRKKWDAKRCSACAQEHVAARAKDATAARALKKSRSPYQPYRFRLPHGSTFAVTYSAVDEMHGTWAGTLTIPTLAGGPGMVFTTGERSSVHDLLSRLGGKYLAWWTEIDTARARMEETLNGEAERSGT